MKLSFFKHPVFLLRLCGTLFLLGVYLVWWREESPLSLPGQLASLVSLGLFWGIGFRFAPLLVQAWTPGESQASLLKEEPSPLLVQGILFPILLLFCAGCHLGVYLLRLATGAGGDFAASLSVWTSLDSAHYLDIARDWYLSQGDWDRLVQLVFLPGYPLAIRLGALLTGNYLSGAILISWVSFALAGGLLYRLFRLDVSHESALWGVGFLCLFPGSFFFAAPMSESLFLLLCVGCLYLGRTRHWLAACLLGGLAAFTRSLGITLVVPLLFEWIQDLAHPPRHGRTSFSSALLSLVSMVLIPGGFLLYCLINYLVAGDPFQFLEYQRVHWSQQAGWFFNTACYQTDQALKNLSIDLPVALGLWLPNLAACYGSLLVILSGLKRIRPSYTAWFMVYFAIAAGTTWLLSAPRYLVAFFPLALTWAQIFQSRRARVLSALALGVGWLYYLFAFAMRWQVW